MNNNEFGRLNLSRMQRGDYPGMSLGAADVTIPGKGFSKYHLLGKGRRCRSKTAWFCDDCGEQVFDLGSGCQDCLKALGV